MGAGYFSAYEQPGSCSGADRGRDKQMNQVISSSMMKAVGPLKVNGFRDSVQGRPLRGGDI